MATSKFASTCADRLDPQEELDFVIPLTAILDGETIDSDFDLVVRPESGLLGLTILGTADGWPDPHLVEDDTAIQLMLGIDAGHASDPAFDTGDTYLYFEVFFTDSAGRPRNRTFKVLVVQL